MRQTPTFLFHIPHHRTVINARQLEQFMASNRPPSTVGIIDVTTKRRIGRMDAHLALEKFG